MTSKKDAGTSRRTYLKLAGAGAATSLTTGCLTDIFAGGGSGGSGGGGGGGGGSGGGGSGGGGGGNSSGGNGNGGGGGGDGSLVISALEPLSGPFSVYGPRHRRGAQFAVERINANGGVQGRQLQMNTVDTASNAQDAVSAFTETIEQQNAIAGIGPAASELGIRVGDVAERRQVPLYLHAAGAVEVVPQDARYTFRTALPATPTVGRAQAQIIKDRGFTNIGIIYEDGVWGDEYEAAVDEYFPDGLDITRNTAPIPQTDFVPTLRGFPDNIELFLGTAHPAGATAIFSQMHQIGMEPELFLAGISPMLPDYNAVGDLITQSYASFNLTDMYSKQYSQLAKEYNNWQGSESFFDHPQVAGYTAIELIAQSVESAGSTNPQDIADATRTGSFDTPFANSPLRYTKWGEPKNTVQVYNGFNLDSTPEYWPNGEFAPEEVYRTGPLPAFKPGSLNLV